MALSKFTLSSHDCHPSRCFCLSSQKEMSYTVNSNSALLPDTSHIYYIIFYFLNIYVCVCAIVLGYTCVSCGIDVVVKKQLLSVRQGLSCLPLHCMPQVSWSTAFKGFSCLYLASPGRTCTTVSSFSCEFRRATLRLSSLYSKCFYLQDQISHL